MPNLVMGDFRSPCIQSKKFKHSDMLKQLLHDILLRVDTGNTRWIEMDPYVQPRPEHKRSARLKFIGIGKIQAYFLSGLKRSLHLIKKTKQPPSRLCTSNTKKHGREDVNSRPESHTLLLCSPTTSSPDQLNSLSPALHPPTRSPSIPNAISTRSSFHFFPRLRHPGQKIPCRAPKNDDCIKTARILPCSHIPSEN